MAATSSAELAIILVVFALVTMYYAAPLAIPGSAQLGLFALLLGAGFFVGVGVAL